MDRKTKCAGCGRERADDLYHKELVEVEVASDLDFVKVCRGRSASEPSEKCLAAARAGKCPGCGEKPSYQSGVSHPVMCEKCKRARGVGKAYLETEEKKWSLIDGTDFFGGVWVGHEDRDTVKGAVKALCKAVGGRTYRDTAEGYNSRGFVPQPKDDPYKHTHADAMVETTEAQHEGLLELQRLLGEVCQAIRKEAFRQGDNLLGRLARGEMTVDDYADKSTKERK